MKIFIAFNEDVFGGYGIRAAGPTEKDAVRALYAEYRETSKDWNEGGVNCKTLQAFEEEWGCEVWELDTNDLATFSGNFKG